MSDLNFINHDPDGSIDNPGNIGQSDCDESYPAIRETPSYQRSAFEETIAVIVCGKSEGTSETASFGIEVANLENGEKQNKKLISEELV